MSLASGRSGGPATAQERQKTGVKIWKMCRESKQEVNLFEIILTGSDMAIFCLLCGKRFQTQTALQQHMEVHAGVRSYICSECNRTFPSHTALKRHLRSHTAGDHPYECEFCGSCFRDENTLKGHKRIHTGEKPYECNGCGKKFSLKHQLETHYRVHTGTGIHVQLAEEEEHCWFWNYFQCFNSVAHKGVDMVINWVSWKTSSSSSKATTRTRPANAHAMAAASIFLSACQLEVKVDRGSERAAAAETPGSWSLKVTAIAGPDRIRQLISNAIGKGEKPFECKLCHQRSRDYSAMIKHLRTHNGASPYQCTICLEYCPSLSAMQKHMKGHKPEDIPPDWRIEKTYLYLCYV
ncbi:Zinc finger and BTB domain-containing protein 16-A [Takifugu flavidus]|uniref:Zinc finger and BTB domain-containing protein 16-A n=1 Tax=Takifugu flavidus TaxID=433684 RepID=A0A5C6P909_9TELE|nr:Zinc finger and BTB domain-containing protein 16-A [Takifugu flavidus]